MRISHILKREITRQFSTFALIGVESTILNYLVFILLFKSFLLNYLLAASIGFTSGVLFGFIFNKIISFRSKKTLLSVFPKYLSIYFFSLIVNLVLLNLFVESLRLEPIISNIIIAPLIILLNFFGTKIIAFENKEW